MALLQILPRIIRPVGSDPEAVTLGKRTPSVSFYFLLCEKGRIVLTPM